MNKRLLSTLFAVLICTLTWAALPTADKYYRIKNANQAGYVLTESYQAGNVVAKTQNSGKDFTQIWYYSSTGLQNAYTARYIQPQSSTSSIFKMGTSAAPANLTQMTDGHILMKVGGNTMHSDASHNIVKWEPENENSHWTFEEVTVTAEEISAARAEYNAWAKTEKEFNTKLTKLQSASYTALTTFFTDKACTELKSNYQSMSDEALKAAITDAGLPEEIADIAVKVKNGWTDELNAAISAQFRVQDYQAYSQADAWRWRSADGKGAGASQFNDMCNPTGVYTTGRDFLFVFVENDIPAGCTLRLSAVDEGTNGFGYNNYNNGTVLQKGINIIGAENNLRNYWLMYTLTDKTKKPADMPKIKVHIEGGHVMGYVDVQGKDEAAANAEYEKILKAANASALDSRADKCYLRLAVKGNYGMFNFQIMCYNRIWSDGNADLLKNNPVVPTIIDAEKWTANYKQGYKIYKSMKFYDDVLRREWGLMGFMKEISEATKENPIEHLYGGVDMYPTYVNNLAYTIMGVTGSNPHSSTGYTHMPGIGGVESSYNGERQDFDTWCVGHESGHNNQSLINLESSMESSNNTFSNIITYLYGYRMSRGNTFADNQNDSYNNVVFAWRDISMTMRMYFNLYLYYHRAGFKQDFYPTLFCLLREDPIKMGTGAAYDDGEHGSARTHNATTTWLHFYKKACQAAQEDLTEYFRLWGFFVPVNKGYFGDYTSYYVTNTQEMIDEAIAWVKAQGWPENKSIMFIEDRLKPVERIDPWATKGAIRPNNSGKMLTAAEQKAQYGDLGHFTDYMPGNVKNATAYSYTVSGTTVNMKGEGGVGILVYDNEGNIIYRSNKLTFNLPAEVSTKPFSIKVMNADNSEILAENQTGADEYRKALENAIADAKTTIALSDATGTKMGFYTPDQLAALQQLINEGQTILDNKTEDSYLSQYNKIIAENLRVQNDEGVQMMTNTGIYTVQSDRSKTRYLNGATANLSTATTKQDAQQWAFVKANANNEYYLQNAKSKKFVKVNLNDDSKIASWSADVDTRTEANSFTLENAGGGSFYMKTNGVSKGNLYLNCDPYGSIAVWSADAGSKWNIARINEIEEYTDRDLKNLVSMTQGLIDEVCVYKENKEKIEGLQTTDKEAPYYLSTNATEAKGVDATHTIDKVLSGVNTYFSTAGCTVNAKRFFTLDLGEGNETTDLALYYRTAPNMHTFKPTTISVMAGSALTSLKTVATLNSLPSSTTTVESYTSPGLTAEQPARYWRFRVEETNGTATTTYPEFALAIIYFYNYGVTITLNEGYESLDKSLITTAKSTSEDVTTALKSESTPLSNYGLYTNLMAAYNKLNDAAIATDIQSVATDVTTAPKGIFDLSGRRISSPAKSGLYIINGKKILIK